MAREFSSSEIIRQKCSTCGSKNKKFTELKSDNVFCGYKLTCCNCGHIDTFFYNEKDNDSNLIAKGVELCIKVSTCRNNNCKYYNIKYPLSAVRKILDNIFKGVAPYPICDGIQNCSECQCKDFCQNKKDQITNIEQNKNLNSHKLDINGYRNNNPKFH